MDQEPRRVVLVTGASSGIGKACAERLQQAGYLVYGTSRQPKPGSRSFEMIRMDIDDDASVEDGVNLILRQSGRLDVLVNNAGFGIAGAIEDNTIEEAKAQLETNFFGTFRVCRAVLPTMRAQGSGYIVNVSSMAGLIGIAFQGLYSASKFAVEGMSEALSQEVKPFGIHVVLVEPGDLNTNFTACRQKTARCQENPAYEQEFRRALAVMEHDEQQGGSPDKVARLIEHIIRTPSPRLRYSVGPLAEKAAVLLKKVVPSRLFERGLMAYYKL
jgi:NAD(P)-dependent dehydrogenase (short-subunit alcohol dehydrogenase family)